MFNPFPAETSMNGLVLQMVFIYHKYMIYILFDVIIQLLFGKIQ